MKRYKVEMYDEDAGAWKPLDGSWPTAAEAQQAAERLKDLGEEMAGSGLFQFRLVEVDE